jgi:hypothetical protein
VQGLRASSVGFGDFPKRSTASRYALSTGKTPLFGGVPMWVLDEEEFFSNPVDFTP